MSQEQPTSQPWRIGILVALIAVVIIVALQIEVTLPFTSPRLNNTYTVLSKPAPSDIGTYDVLGHQVSASQAAELRQTPEGEVLLSPHNGAVAVTQDLIDLGRDAFYLETFGNEVFNTDVTGILDGPLNLISITKAILLQKGMPTTNLQIPLDTAITVGGRTFQKGTVLNTGLDLPAGSLFPLGIRIKYNQGHLQSSLTCAVCHAAVEPETGRILEGAPNVDLDTGLLLALASNSATWFRHTGVNPTALPLGKTAYVNAEGEPLCLPDPTVLEAAVDTALLDWPPGYFDSSADLEENPSQIPPSYTHGAWPYGWSGFASVGWFHGLTTFNNNVHAANTDTTTLADASKAILDIDKDVYLGAMLQNAANSKYRLPPGANPAQFFEQVDPTPNAPGLNELVPMPNYPQGSVFIPNGMMASSPGLPVAAQNNGMSAWQNTLAPPASAAGGPELLRQGKKVFEAANCASCHSGRYFTNHAVIPEQDIRTQPSRANGNAGFAKNFAPPQTYPNDTPVPLPAKPRILDVPTDITPDAEIQLAYAINNPEGGYKVTSLIGLGVTAPYLHDGGVAASATALKPEADGFYSVFKPEEIGIAGTALQHIAPDPEASLRVLVDRNLREVAIAANRQEPSLQRANIDGRGHEYWVDQAAGFSAAEQNALIQFLLSLDDDPDVLLSAELN